MRLTCSAEPMRASGSARVRVRVNDNTDAPPSPPHRASTTHPRASAISQYCIENLLVLAVGKGARQAHDVCNVAKPHWRSSMDFTAVAHDLRAPLNVMLGHMQLLAVERLSDTDRRRLGVVEAQIHRMVRLLDRCTDPTCPSG